MFSSTSTVCQGKTAWPSAAICAAQVLQWTGLPTSVGFGPTKTLAKLANHVAKMADRKPGSYDGRAGPGLPFRPDGTRAALKPSLARHRSGRRVGHWPTHHGAAERSRHPQRARSGRADTATLRRQFNVVLEKTVLELRGTSCLDVDDEPAGQPADHVLALLRAAR
jgi:DNA polymerase V